MRCSVLVLLLAATLLPMAVQAHSRSQSYSTWQALGEGRYQASARVRAVDLTRDGLHPQAPGFLSRAAEHLGSRLRLEHADGPCRVDQATARLPGAWVQARWRVQCPATAGLTLRSELFAGQQTHLHMVSLIDADGRSRHKALIGNAREWPLGVQAYASGPAAARAFLGVGLSHIASGWDHLAFLLGLLLLCRRPGALAVLATGFTLGHSVTLAAAALGLLAPATATVEAMIALSIALVAAEYALRQTPQRALPLVVAGALGLTALLAPLTVSALSVAGMALFAGAYLGVQRDSPAPERLRVLVAAGFGLFHGFGFGGALAQLHWPAQQSAWALLGFNLGVEFGQLLVLAIAWPLVQAVRSRPAIPAALNALLAAAGSYWFVLRAFA